MESANNIKTIDDLRQIIINYLNTCEGKACRKNCFWSNVSNYCGQILSIKMFGVKKMKVLFKRFKDILQVRGEYIYFISNADLSEQEPVIEVVESDSDEESSSSNSSVTYLGVSTSSCRDSGNSTSLKEPGNGKPNTSSLLGGQDSFASTSAGYIPLSGPKLSPLNQNAPRTPSFGSPATGNFQNPFNSAAYGSRGNPYMPATRKKPLMSSTPLANGQSGSFSQNAVPIPPLSEWPRPSPRTGPPPGTKIIEDKKEIVVQPLFLPWGTILTSSQVDTVVQECIDLLSEAHEHVSMERVEAMLMGKFKVRFFGALNLREKNFHDLPTAMEHNRKLGKVNAYIQSFARSRTLCTLFELKECLSDLHPEAPDFEHLKLGPLQKMPIVNYLFKFPLDEYIPEITSLDLIENLACYLQKYNKWDRPVSVDEFMNDLTEFYHVSNGFSLGVRMRSMALAIQMLKKSQKDAAANRRQTIIRLHTDLNRDLNQAFQRFRSHILQHSPDVETMELRRHYANLPPEKVAQELLTKFEILGHLLIADASPELNEIDRAYRGFKQFMKCVLEVPIPRMLYHLSVCLSDLQIQESAQEFLQQEVNRHQRQEAAQAEKAAQQSKKVPTKAVLTEKLVVYLNRCLELGTLQLTQLEKMESKLAEEFSVSFFTELGYGRFLEYLLSEPKIKKLLQEAGGTMLGAGSDGHFTESIYRPSQAEILQLIGQLKQAGVTQTKLVEQILCEQFHVPDLQHLGHGTVTNLCLAASKPSKHVHEEHHIHYETALCRLQCATPHDCGQVGIQGSQNKEAAMACLTNCPLLEDMMEWSHWSLVFEPQLGSFRTFIQKYGGYRQITLAAGQGTAVSDFMALEVEPGKFLKIVSQPTLEEFFSTLDSVDALRSAGYLVSLIVANRGLENTPLALLANHVKTCLIGLHAQCPDVSTPGGPPSSDSATSKVDLAVQFVTDILMRIPTRICAAIANQVLLEPLSSVMGSVKSKREIAHLCQLPGQQQRLELLGCLLGLPEWTTSLQQKYHFLASHLVEERRDSIIEEVESDDECQEDIVSIHSDSSEDESEPVTEDVCSVPPEKTSSQSELQDNSQQAKEAVGSPVQDKLGRIKPDSSLPSKTDDGIARLQESEVTAAASVTSEATQLPAASPETADSERVPMEEVPELTREQICQQLIESIQREEFGLGVNLDETGQKLMQKQQERQGRSLQRLSKDLYSKETHFVLELIQNADDNSYDNNTAPTVEFIINTSGVTVLNNELGFEENNIRALCDVGKSTKEKQRSGYIGQKGIGFKSVYRVTSRPEVHSNGFHITFDVNSGPMGYILPHWISDYQVDDSWQTKIVLPWTEEIKKEIKTHAARFNDIQPSLLLFLHRLKKIVINNEVEGSVMSMQRLDLSSSEVQISHNFGLDRWLVSKKILETEGVSVQMKSRLEVKSTEIAVAFPLQDSASSFHSQTHLTKLPVFAFLPLRSYGFRFIIQGDFDVPSSREDVDRDTSWNQWLRNEIPGLFVEALELFKNHPTLTPITGLLAYLQFIPLEGEVMGFFKPVVTRILALLRAKDCLPVVSGRESDFLWKMPSKTVISKDPLVQEILSPELLQHHLGLFYLHPQVAATISDPLVQALGVETVTPDHLLQVGQCISQNWDSIESGPEQIVELAKWLACVYRSMEDFRDHTNSLHKLCRLKVIPLSDGCLVSPADVTLFLLCDNRSGVNLHSKQDPLLELKKDLNLVHSELTNTGDDEINSQVVKLLLRMGVKQMNAHDLIHSHILPVLKSDDWMAKTKEVLMSYLVYIKIELEKNQSVVDMADLRPVARLVTNHGIKTPQTDDVHFSPAYRSNINLSSVFPGIDWFIVDSGYLPASASLLDLQTWHGFLSSLGVVEFLQVKATEVSFDKNSMSNTPWSQYVDSWPDSAEGYIVRDKVCPEFQKLVTANQKTDLLFDQMIALYEILDKEWDSRYKHHTRTQLHSKSGQVLKEDIPTSFGLQLASLAWIPSVQTCVETQDLRVVSREGHYLRPAPGLYLRHPEVEDLLANTVTYLKPVPLASSSFTKFLSVKSSVDVSSVKGALISWCQRDQKTPGEPRTFCTSLQHMCKVYVYLSENLPSKEAQDVFHNYPAIFVPVVSQGQMTNRDVVAGQMLTREEVRWCDPNQLFTKYSPSLDLYKSPLAKIKFLQAHYHHIEEVLTPLTRVAREPNTYHLAQLLQHIATVHSLTEPGVLRDTLFIFSKIGTDLRKIIDCVGGVKTNEAMVAEGLQPQVVSLLSSAAVFPTRQGLWVRLTDQPMVADSPELESIFSAKPGVHLLQLEAKDTAESRSSNPAIDPDSLRYFLSLFPQIKPLSECVQTGEITTMFQQCVKGQQFMHDIVGLLQRFLYFVFPQVYHKIKSKKATTLKELMFCQVEKLEVKYELIGRPQVFEIKPEKCVLQGKHFYFHQRYINNQVDVIREVAKYFSEGVEDCVRELRSFMSQAVPILESRSDETMDSFLARQSKPVGTLPPEEAVWEIPPPIIEPELNQVNEEDKTMFYQRAHPPSDAQSANQDQGVVAPQAWPPRSGNYRDSSQGARYRDFDPQSSRARTQPRGPSYLTTSKLLPSSIKFGTTAVQNEAVRSGLSETPAGQVNKDVPSVSVEDAGTDHAALSRAVSNRDTDQNLSVRTMVDRDEQTVQCHTSAMDKRLSCPNQVSGEERVPSAGTARACSLVDGGEGRLQGKDSADNTRKRKHSCEAEQEEVAIKRQSLRDSDEEMIQNLILEQNGSSQEGRIPLTERPTSNISENSSNRSLAEPVLTFAKTNRHDKIVPSQFAAPVWSKFSQELSYTELSVGHNLNSCGIQLSEKSAPEDIGRWGELLVWDYLQRQKMAADSSIVEVVWLNSQAEVGLPFDFEVSYRTDEPDKTLKKYVEVKTTIHWDIRVFPVSSNQIEFANQQKECYDIYRVFGAGKSNAKLTCLKNVAEKLKTKSLRLYLVI